MTRAEMRRAQKQENKAKTATYNFTQAQLDAVIKEYLDRYIDEIKAAAAHDAVGSALELMLYIPMKTLMTHYWPKTYEKKLPDFTKHMLEYYNQWENGEFDMNEMRQIMWDTCGFKIEKDEGQNESNIE